MSSILPEGLTMRPPTMDDLEIAYKLSLAHDLALHDEGRFSLEELRGDWTAPTHDLARDQRLVFAQDGQLIANLYLEHRQYARFFIDVCIHPDHSDPRTGDALLELGESWAHARMTQAEPGVRVTLNCWISSDDQDALARCQRMGLTEIRRYWDMEIQMQEAPAQPEWPAGIELRPFVPERDARAVFDMIEKAFNDHWGHLPGNFDTWQHRRVGRVGFDPSLWFIAYEGEQPVGGSLCSNDGPGWLDTLGILRPWRRKGLGLALLLHTFGEFYRRGQQRVLLGVDSQNLTGAVRLYQRAGMSIKHEKISLEKELRAGVELSTQALAV